MSRPLNRRVAFAASRLKRVRREDLYELLYEEDVPYQILYYRPVIVGTANRNTMGVNVTSMDIGAADMQWQPYRVGNIRGTF